MLKTLFLRPTLGDGGADRVTVTLLRELDRGRFDPHLVLLRREGPFLESLPKDVRVLELGSGRVRTALLALVQILKRERPQILFSTSSGTNCIAIAAAKLSRLGTRVVVSERNVQYRDRRNLSYRAHVIAKRWLYPLADEITAVSEGVRSDMKARLGLPKSRVRVVGNPIVDSELIALSREPLSHPWFGDTAEAPVILGVGRLIRQKGFDLLLQAFSQCKEILACRLVILGEGELRGQLQKLAEDLGVSKDVDFPGFNSNPFRYMSRASVFVLSSRYEGLPGVLIQSMACGCPVVSTDCESGPSEIITDGKDGVLVPVEESAALGAAILKLLESPGDRKRMGAKASVSAREFAVQKVVARYEAALTGDSPSSAEN